MAVKITAAGFAAALKTTQTTITDRIYEASKVMVEDYAPAAPSVLQDEALIRFGSYWLTASPGATREEEIGPQRVEHVTNHGPAFRNCGAAAILSRWKIRRGGAIG